MLPQKKGRLGQYSDDQIFDEGKHRSQHRKSQSNVQEPKWIHEEYFTGKESHQSRHDSYSTAHKSNSRRKPKRNKELFSSRETHVTRSGSKTHFKAQVLVEAFVSIKLLKLFVSRNVKLKPIVSRITLPNRRTPITSNSRLFCKLTTFQNEKSSLMWLTCARLRT